MPTLPNILMFAIDSLRADHCSAYGYHRLTTPCADRLAARGVLFANHFSAYIPTLPAYSSILTGHDVMTHQVVTMREDSRLDSRMATLPKVLRETGGYTSVCIGLDKGSGPGFDRYVEYNQCWRNWSRRPARKAENLNRAALPVLEQLVQSGSPWLLFMRHMDPHAPYLPPPPYDTLFYSKDPTDPRIPDTMGPIRDCPNFAEFHLSWMPDGIRDITYPTAMYDGAVAYMDTCIQALLNRLEELGQNENTLVIFTADHGETLDEHGCYFDHHGLYEPTVHVPLILSHPGRLPQGMRITGYTQHQDLTPTLLDYIGLDEAKAPQMAGRSVLPLIQGERASNYKEFYLTECTWMRKRGWRTAEWKLIEALEPDFHGKPPIELYHLITDPGETVNLAEQEPAVVQQLQQRMHCWVEQRLKETGKPDPILQYELGLDQRLDSIAAAWKLQARVRRVLSRGLSSRQPAV